MKLASVLIASLFLVLTTRAQAPAPRSARVAMHEGRPTLYVNDAPMLPMIYALTDVPGGRWSWEELPQHNIEAFCEAGIRLFQVDLFLDHVWFEDGTIDPSMGQRQIRGVQDVCPGASVFFRFHVTAPKWWMRTHPDEWVAYADMDYQPERTFGMPRIIEDDNFPVRRVSMASDVWRTEATEALQTFLRRLAATPEGDALAGVQVANGVYGEWHQWGFFYNEPDVGPAMTRAFRDWLRDRYGTVEALRAAWNDPTASFATVAAPDVEARRTTRGIFRDPQREQRVIDYYRCMQEITARNIIHFARVVKETWPRPTVTGTFYGYYFSTFARQAAGGHLELQRILASPYVDYLSGPQAYEPEADGLGEPYRSRSLIASVRLHGKLWLDEMDKEVTLPMYRSGRYEELLRASVATLRRNVAFSYTKGQGLWFYDFGPAGVDLDGRHIKHKGAQGYWDHPVVLNDIHAMKRLFEAHVRQPYRSGADVLFVYDTDSFYYTGSLHHSDPVTNTIVDYATLNAFKSGVVFDPIHLDDLDEVDLSGYRVVVFGNTYELTAEERAFIRDEVARDGRDLVWYYAPGYTDGTALDPSWMSEVTGVTLAPVAIEGPPEITMPLTDGYAFTYSLGGGPIRPLFAVEDPQAEALGTYTGTDAVAIARKDMADYTAWYVALPSKQPLPLRHILHRTDAHIYSEQGDVVYAGGGLVVVHTAEGGVRTVTLRNGTDVRLDLPPGPSTVLLDSTTGEILMGAPDIPPSPPYPSR